MTATARPKCDLYKPGHCVHWIAAKQASRTTPRTGRLTELTKAAITVEYLDRTTRYRSHDTVGLQAVAPIGSKVGAFEDYRLLSYDIDYWHGRVFGIALDEDESIPCSYEPLVEVTPEFLAECLEIRGGFSVTGESVVGWGK
jgi:hypothetical protein